MITVDSVVFNCMVSKGRTNISDRELAEYALHIKWHGTPEILFNTKDFFVKYPEEAKRLVLELYRY